MDCRWYVLHGAQAVLWFQKLLDSNGIKTTEPKPVPKVRPEKQAVWKPEWESTLVSVHDALFGMSSGQAYVQTLGFAFDEDTLRYIAYIDPLGRRALVSVV